MPTTPVQCSQVQAYTCDGSELLLTLYKEPHPALLASEAGRLEKSLLHADCPEVGVILALDLPSQEESLV